VAGRPIGKRHQEDVRRKIQASQLINRLNDHVLGKLELTPTQVRAAEILLKKSVPDLSSVEHSTDPDKPMHQLIEMVIVDAG
jgi:hypothetical protein